jgi:hypothetical protein
LRLETDHSSRLSSIDAIEQHRLDAVLLLKTG